MTKRNRHVQDEELNYWQSISDVMAALLLVVLLIMMLFILYMTRVPDLDAVTDPHISDEVDQGDGEDDWDGRYHSIYWNEDEEIREIITASGGEDEDSEERRPEEEHHFEEWDGLEKAAVYVTVRDGETGMSIKEEGITFKLFEEHEGLKVLHTYYPKHESFDRYETTEFGNFYLPEKIELGAYYFSEISVPYGYDAAEDLHFTVEESYDWEDPFALTINLFPCKNVIRIRSVDRSTNEALGGAVYEVVASEDIITVDGTLRYHQGEVVDRIVCDPNGVGSSEELYLGHYVLRQVKPTEYYACAAEEHVVEVDRKDREIGAGFEAGHDVWCDEASLEHVLMQEKTRFIVTLLDELYGEAMPLEGYSFMLRSEAGDEIAELSTDALGEIYLDELKKNTVYVLTQETSPEGYRSVTEPIRFTVGEDGRIDGEALGERVATNRMIRVELGVADRLFGNEIADRSMALYDAEGNLVHLWTSTAMAETLEGLEPGEYTLTCKKQSMDLTIADTAQLQQFRFRIWSTLDILAMIGGGLIAVLIVSGLIHIIMKKKGGSKR